MHFAVTAACASPSPGWVDGLLFVLLLGGVAFCAASETSLFTLTRVQLRDCAASRHWATRRVALVMQRAQAARRTLLLAGVTFSVALMSHAVVAALRLPARGWWVVPLAMCLTIAATVLLGDVLPRAMALAAPLRFAPVAAVLLHAADTVLRPAEWLLSVTLVEPLKRAFTAPSADAPRALAPDELRALLTLSGRDGVVRELESAFLQEVADLGRIKVRDVMVPRVDVKAYNVDAPAEGLRDLVRLTRLKKIPVYRGAIDDVVGLVYAKVLFLDREKPLRDIVQPVRFVPNSASCEQLLRFFRETRSQLAIVVDEYGGMAGLVTLEDLLEVIVGDIRDPEDAVPAPEIVPLSETEYELSGRLSARDWTQVLGTRGLDPKAATISGLITSRLGRAPRVGDRICFANVELRVLKVHRHRIDRVALRLLPEGSP